MWLLPLHRSHSQYLAASLAVIDRRSASNEPLAAVESDMDTLSQIVVARNRLTLGPITSRLRRHTEAMQLISYQYGHDPSAAIHRWAAGVLLTLQQEMSRLEEVNQENLLALSFIDL